MMVAWLKGQGLRTVLVVVLGGCACWNAGAAAYIMAKAELAQILLDRAWQHTRDGGAEVRPWAWADTWPVARLSFSTDGEALVVLEGGSGRNLAFGPAHLSATPLPGESGNSVIVGHRDTHFAALEAIVRGDLVFVERTDDQLTYRVTHIAIVHESNVELLEDVGTDALTLITCYPFGAIAPGTDERYVVMAERVQTSDAINLVYD